MYTCLLMWRLVLCHTCCFVLGALKTLSLKSRYRYVFFCLKEERYHIKWYHAFVRCYVGMLDALQKLSGIEHAVLWSCSEWLDVATHQFWKVVWRGIHHWHDHPYRIVRFMSLRKTVGTSDCIFLRWYRTPCTLWWDFLSHQPVLVGFGLLRREVGRQDRELLGGFFLYSVTLKSLFSEWIALFVVGWVAFWFSF